MKKIFYIILTGFFAFLFSGCKKVEITSIEEYDQTLIIEFVAYSNGSSIVENSAVIDEEAGTVVLDVDDTADLSNVFAVFSISTGSTLSPGITGPEDWSMRTRSFKIISASGERSKDWTVTLE